MRDVRFPSDRYRFAASRRRKKGANTGSREILLDHLVGLYEKRLRQAEAESFCGFQVDYHFEFGRQLNWKFVYLRSSEYAVHVGCRPTKQIGRVNP